MNDVCFLDAHDGQQMHGLCACSGIVARHACVVRAFATIYM